MRNNTTNQKNVNKNINNSKTSNKNSTKNPISWTTISKPTLNKKSM